MKIKEFIHNNYGMNLIIVLEEMKKRIPAVGELLEKEVDDFNRLFSDGTNNLKIIFDTMIESQDMDKIIRFLGTMTAYIYTNRAYDGMKPFLDEEYYKERNKIIDKLGNRLGL